MNIHTYDTPAQLNSANCDGAHIPEIVVLWNKTYNEKTNWLEPSSDLIPNGGLEEKLMDLQPSSNLI